MFEYQNPILAKDIVETTIDKPVQPNIYKIVTWINTLDINGNQVTVEGQVEQVDLTQLDQQIINIQKQLDALKAKKAMITNKLAEDV